MTAATLCPATSGPLRCARTHGHRGDHRDGAATWNRDTRGNAARGRRMVTITLSDDARARLDELAAECGESRSGMVERLISAVRT